MVYVMNGMLTLGVKLVRMNTLFAAVMSRIREIGVPRRGLSPPAHSPCIFDRIADPRFHWRRVLACLLAMGLNGFALRIPMRHSDSRSNRFCSPQGWD